MAHDEALATSFGPDDLVARPASEWAAQFDTGPRRDRGGMQFH
jgi:hypothetical protein